MPTYLYTPVAYSKPPNARFIPNLINSNALLKIPVLRGTLTLSEKVVLGVLLRCFELKNALHLTWLRGPNVPIAFSMFKRDLGL
jgi:hypothetical protein